jgi:hypothetical protein
MVALGQVQHFIADDMCVGIELLGVTKTTESERSCNLPLTHRPAWNNC